MMLESRTSFTAAVARVMEVTLRAAGGGGTAIAAAVVIVVVCVASKLMRRGRGRLPPGPWALPVVGNLLQLMLVRGEPPHRAMARLSKKYGPIVFLKLGTAPAILVSDSSWARACLSGQNDKIFASRPSMEMLRHLIFGQFPGIVMAPYGNEWRHARKLYTLQLFTTQRVKLFEPIRRSEIMALVRRIELQVGQPLNLTQAIKNMSEVTTCKMLLGKPLAEIGDAKLGMDMQMLVHRLSELFHVPMIGDYIPALGFLDRKLKATLDELHVALDTLVSKLVHERQRRSPGSPQVVLDVLLESAETDNAKTMIMELLAASLDTSSATLDWAMSELVGNPQVMKRLQVELDQVTNAKRRIITEDEIENLVYLKAVLKETMRVHPPIPMLVPHMSTEECEVGGYRIPKGSRLLVNAWAIGREPKSWEDPERFMPERFLTEKGALMDFRGKHFQLLPFGSGRRSCPGMPLALPLLHTTLANLIHTFDWILPPGHSLNFNEHFSAVVSRSQPLIIIPQIRHKD